MKDDSVTGARILDVPADWTLPRLGKKVVPAGGRVVATDDAVRLTHYDTATGDLAALDIGVTLEEGTGTWTVTVLGTASAFGATAARTVPAPLRDLLLGVRAGQALRAGDRESRERIVHRVLDADGVERGTVTDVRSTRTAPRGRAGEVRTTRHLEVAGWDGFPEAATARLVRHDAIERVVPARAADDTVGRVLTGFLTEQRAAALHADLGLRRGDDTVHAFRVAVRRVRSALRVVTVWDVSRAADLDAELRWLSAELGAVRDLEVLRDHLTRTCDAVAEQTDLAAGAAVDAARVAVTDALAHDHAAAVDALGRTLRSRRYLAVVRELTTWTLEPPFTGAASEPADRLARYVRRAAKDLDRKLDRAGASAPRLHKARKAAKRARYVAAAAGGSAGKHGPRVEKHAKALQTALGDHQDHVLACDYLAGLAGRLDGPAGFRCGVLWSYERDRAEAALRAATDGVAGD